MRLDTERKLFFGVKVDSKLRDAMHNATPGDRHYFAEDSPYLRILSTGEEQWLGKMVDCGIAPSEVDDITRNVISILNRIAPGTRVSASSMRVFTVDEHAPTPPPPPGRGQRDDEGGGGGGGDYGGGRGSYGY